MQDWVYFSSKSAIQAQKPDFIYVDNIVSALMLATTDLLNEHSKAKGKAYFVSDGKIYTLKLCFD